MSTSLGDALRERLELRTILVWLVLLSLLWFVFDTSLLQLVTTTVVSAVIGLNGILADAYDLRKSIRHVGLGAAAVLGGTFLVFSEDSVFFPVVFFVIGSWFVLDTVQTIRHEGATVAPRDGHDVYRDYVARRVHEILKEHPQTRRELDEALDADDEAIDMAVERLLDREVIKRTGSEFRILSSSDRSGLDRTREWIIGMVSRIARPITIEFERETPDSEDDRTTGLDPNSSDSHGERDPESADNSL